MKKYFIIELLYFIIETNDETGQQTKEDMKKQKIYDPQMMHKPLNAQCMSGKSY